MSYYVLMILFFISFLSFRLSSEFSNSKFSGKAQHDMEHEEITLIDALYNAVSSSFSILVVIIPIIVAFIVLKIFIKLMHNSCH